MANAHSELTGQLAVALVTAGPGVTNAVTGIANAHVARMPVLVLSGSPPRPPQGRGALQELDQVEFVQPITRYAHSVCEPGIVLDALTSALSRARGEGCDPSPVYLDFPTDTLRADIPRVMPLPEYFERKPPRVLPPSLADVDRVVDALWQARRPLIISGRCPRCRRGNLGLAR